MRFSRSAVRSGFPAAWVFVAVVFAAGMSPALVHGGWQNETGQVEDWIRQLGDPAFSIRQHASRQLIDAGPGARAALEQATNSPNLEIANRAIELLQRIQAPQQDDLPADQAVILRDFQAADARLRSATFQSLINKGQVDLTLLVARDYPAQRKDLFASGARKLNLLLMAALVAGDWKAIDEAINDPLVIENAIADVYHYHAANGTLDGWISSEMDRLQQRRNDGQAFAAEALDALLAVLRMRGDFERAEQLVVGIPDADLRQACEIQLLFESGQWDQLLGRMVPESAVPGPGTVTANAAQRALIQLLANDRAGLDETIAGLKQRLVIAEQEKNAFAIDSLRGQLLLVGLVTLDWPLTKNHLGAVQRPNEVYQFYSSLFRYQEAFEELELGRSLASRKQWMDTQLERFQEISRQISDTSSANRRSPEYRALLAELSRIRQLCFDVIDQLAILGLDEEAILYTQMLVLADPERLPTCNEAILTLVRHDQWDAAWELIRWSLPRQSVSDLCQQLFRPRFAGVNGFLDPIAQAYPEPITQLKTMSGLVNSPLGTSPEFDLERELARYQQATPVAINGLAESCLGQIHELHGQTRASVDWLEQAARMGSIMAARALADRAFFRGDFRTAATYFDEYWRTRKTVDEALIAAHCWQQLADTESDPQRRQQWQLAEREARYGAMVAWRSRRIGLASVASAIDDMELQESLTWILKSQVYGLGQEVLTNENDRGQLAANEFSDDCDRPHRAAIELAIKRFGELSVNNVGAKTLPQWAEESRQLWLAMARVRAAAGETEAAANLAIRELHFFPADSSIVESIADDLAANDAAMDRVFSEASRQFESLLAAYPDAALHQNNYAWACLCANRNLDAAERHAARALQLRPGRASYLDTMAEIQFARGDLAAAAELSRQSAIANPFRRYYFQQQTRFADLLRASQMPE